MLFLLTISFFIVCVLSAGSHSLVHNTLSGSEFVVRSDRGVAIVAMYFPCYPVSPKNVLNAFFVCGFGKLSKPKFSFTGTLPAVLQ